MIGHTKGYYTNTVRENSIDHFEILPGALTLMKTTLCKTVNGFDEDYFMYGEDID